MYIDRDEQKRLSLSLFKNMKYKQNLLNKFVTIDSVVQKLSFQISRGLPGETLEVTVEDLKEKLKETVWIIDLEQDDQLIQQ